MRKARKLELEPESVLIDTAPDEYYRPKDTIVENIAFRLGENDELLVEFGFEGSDQTLNDHQLSNDRSSHRTYPPSEQGRDQIGSRRQP